MFYFFSIIILLICNISYESLLDKSLEIRVISLAILLFLLFTLPFLSKHNFLKKADFSILKNPFILIYVLWVILQGVGFFFAQNTGESLHEFLKTGSFFVLFFFLLLYIVPQKGSRTIFLKIMVLFTLLISIIGIVQALNMFSEHGFSLTNAKLIKGNFANKNMFSQILFFGFTFSAFTIYFLKKTWKNLAFLAALSSLLLIVLLMTRGVWLALIIASIVSLIFFVIYIRKHIRKSHLSRKSLIVFSGVGLASILLFGVISLQFDYGQSIKKRIESSFNLSDNSTNSRFKLWGKTTELIEENPMLGVGSGNWKVEILKHDVIRYNAGWEVPRRMHNDYLTVLSEIGFIGFIVYLTMFGFIIFYLNSIIRQAKNPDDKIFALALLFGTVGYMCFSFFSFPKERVEAQILLNLIFAFSTFLYYQTKAKKITQPHKNSLPILFIIALSILSFTALSSWKRMQAEIAINKMYINLSQNRSKATIYPLIKDIRSPFVSISPRNTPFLQLEAKFMYVLNKNTKEVIKVYKDALKDSPYHVRTIIELANVYFDTGDLENAMKYGDRAYNFSPSNEVVLLSLAMYAEKLGQLDSSLCYLDKVSPRSLKSNYFPQITRVLKKKSLVLFDKETNQAMKVEIAYLTNANEGKSLRIIYKRSQNNNTNYEYEFMKEVQKQFKNKHPEQAKNYVSPLLSEYGVIPE
ncbi:MAG: O-antigen ligase family protein [Bacteroidota bacterium]|nr:O-antigen ligase family protein [Bacteroidota bacterium]